MAQLPLVTGRSVETQSAPDTFQRVEYTPDAFGAGIGRALQGIGAEGQRLAQLEKHLRSENKANEALNNLNPAKDELRDWMYNPKDGILSRTGGNALGSGAQAQAVTDSIKKKYLEQIQDPEVKAAWTKLWDREAETAKDQAASHELSQMGEYKTQTIKGILQGAIQDAYNGYNDPKVVDQSIDTTLRAIRANQTGAPESIVKASEADAISNIRLAVLSRLASEDPYQAQDYYNEHKKDFTGKDHVAATQFIQPAVVQQQAQEWLARQSHQGPRQTWDLWSALESAESSGNPNARSPAGAIGIAQLMPETARLMARKLGYTDISHLSDKDLTSALTGENGKELNRELGRAYLNEQLQTFGGDIEAALVAYNAGPEGAKDFLEHNVGRGPGNRDYNVPGRSKIKTETEAYVQKILGSFSGGQGAIGAAQGRMTAENWTLRNFKPSDIIAPTAGGAWVDARAATGLDTLADRMAARFPGFKIKINEDPSAVGVTAGRRRGTADPNDNPHVRNSQHLHGTAFDIQVQTWTDEQKAAFLSEARQLGFGGIGFYGPNGHLHIDMGGVRTWGHMPAWARGPMKIPVGQVEGAPAAPAGTVNAPSTPGYRGSFYVGLPEENSVALLEASQAIADTQTRTLVQSMIRKQAAEQTAVYKQAEANDKNAAWQYVLGGGDPLKLDPTLRARLDPSFITGPLMSYAKAIAEGGVKQDWTAWQEVSQRASDGTLLSADVYTEYRNRLDDKHFDEALTLQRAAVKEAKGDQKAIHLMANMRTRQEILNDAAVTAGFNTKTTSGAKEAAMLARQLDDRIALEQVARNKELSATEIQDIVDKLLITDKAPGVFTFSQGRAMEATEPATFVAATTWDEVAPDDQATLVNTYQSMWKKPPSQELAVDLYNRAIQVYLGAPAKIPEEDLPKLRQGLTARLGREPTEQEMSDKYAQYLLTLLGRAR